MFGSDDKVLNMKDNHTPTKKPGRQSPANLNIAWCGSPPHTKGFQSITFDLPISSPSPTTIPSSIIPSTIPLYHSTIHFHPQYHYTIVPSRIPLYHPLYHHTTHFTTQNTTIPPTFSSISSPSSTTIPPNVSAAFVYFHGNVLILCKSLRAVLLPLAERERKRKMAFVKNIFGRIKASFEKVEWVFLQKDRILFFLIKQQQYIANRRQLAETQ